MDILLYLTRLYTSKFSNFPNQNFRYHQGQYLKNLETNNYIALNTPFNAPLQFILNEL